LNIIIQGYLTDKLITQGFNSKPSTPPLGLTIITSGLLSNKLITQGYFSAGTSTVSGDSAFYYYQRKPPIFTDLTIIELLRDFLTTSISQSD
jgi:hypothetical protein